MLSLQRVNSLWFNRNDTVCDLHFWFVSVPRPVSPVSGEGYHLPSSQYLLLGWPVTTLDEDGKSEGINLLAWNLVELKSESIQWRSLRVRGFEKDLPSGSENVHDYTETGSWTEQTFIENTSDFQELHFRQKLVVNICFIDPGNHGRPGCDDAGGSCACA